MSEQSVTKGFAILSAAGIIVKLLSLLYIPFLLNIIGEEGNGVYAAAYQVYVLIYVISNSGIPVGISKLVSELSAVGNYRDALRSFRIARFLLLVVGVVMAVLMAIFSRPLAVMLHYEKSHLAILALSPALLFTAVASAYRGYFQGRGNMFPTAVSQIMEQIINVVFTLIFAALLLRHGLEAACAGGTIGTSLGALFSAVYLVWFYKTHSGQALPEKNVDRAIKRYAYFDLVKKVVGYGVPITLSIGLQYAGSLIDVWNVKSRLLAAGFEDTLATQMYSHLYKYQQLINAPMAVVAALAATILPAIAAARALKNHEQVQNRVNLALRLCFMVTIPAAVGFAVLSQPIYELLKYGQGSYLMLFGSINLILLAVVQVQTSILQGSGELYKVTFILTLGIIGKLTTNYFLIAIPGLNISGAIIGSIVSYLIPILLNGLLIRKTLGIESRLFRAAVKPFIASVAMGGCVYGTYRLLAGILGFINLAYVVNALAALISIFVGVMVYVTVMVLIKGVNSEDLDMVPKRFARYIPTRVFDRRK